jgi:hypothetical protein
MIDADPVACSVREMIAQRKTWGRIFLALRLALSPSRTAERHITGRFDNLADGGALTARKIDGNRFASAQQVLQCQDVRAGEIGYVHLIAFPSGVG